MKLAGEDPSVEDLMLVENFAERENNMIRRFASVSRREFLQAGTVGIVSATSVRANGVAAVGQPERGRLDQPVASVKALVFDVFGTVVDWADVSDEGSAGPGDAEGSYGGRGEVRGRLEPPCPAPGRGVGV